MVGGSIGAGVSGFSFLVSGLVGGSTGTGISFLGSVVSSLGLISAGFFCSPGFSSCVVGFTGAVFSGSSFLGSGVSMS